MPRGVPEKPEPPESILARVQTPFLERALDDFPAWVKKQAELSLDVQGRSRHMVRAAGRRIASFDFRAKWLLCWIHPYDPGDASVLRSKLSDPSSVVEDAPSPKYIRFHLSNNRDLDVFKQVILRRRDAALRIP
jgi:hypothetical protein